MTFRLFFLCVTFSVLTLSAAFAQKTTLIEHFTSAYCEDALASHTLTKDIYEDPAILVFQCHLSYFVRDPEQSNGYDHKKCEHRQLLYNDVFGNLTMQTPLIVVNGLYDSSGLNENVIEASLKLAKTKPLAPILTEQIDDHIKLNLPDLDRIQMDIFLVGFQSSTSDTNYKNIVRSFERIEKWDGKPQTLMVEKPRLDKCDQIAVIAQNTQTGEVIALGHLYLNQVQ